MSLTGDILIGSKRLSGIGATFKAVNPATGEVLEPAFAFAGAAEVERAGALAAAAFDIYRETAPEARAAFLESIAAEILALGDDLVARACAESGLPRPRIEGERMRTVGQLRLFAAVVRAGHWLDLRVDPALPERKPLPRPDLRQRHIALGPVAVFGASNFPLAFSVAGGDTASALAAGCPVVAKGHPAHPGTGELVATAVLKAVAAHGLPDGTFSLLLGGNETGIALVKDARIKAVGFTGSRSGGLALSALAAARPEPIPVYAEMSSINPVYLLPGALAAGAEKLGRDFIGSVILGAGQFCTNPGLVLAVGGPDLDSFVASAAAALADYAPSAMLTPGIHRAYEAGRKVLSENRRVDRVAEGKVGEGVNRGTGALFVTEGADFLADETLSHEVFGASSLVVRCRDEDELLRVSRKLEGQLTVTLHLATSDLDAARRLMPVLEMKAGRILANGWPTGVEVSPAMMHGGPFPATSDGRSTSVGSLAIRRFLRPVCYQDMPSELLPDALRDSALEALPHMMDGTAVLP
jgi:alpha-ketoglutaric semialdehyde dehydrogenase